ncbi:hypothetical protein [Sphingobium sp. BS19]|uniref:hypothetical protein n=1 Tax=Sphingobium sp. BS19 TaxID=3018973 RepID=UPI002492DC24|nr:hypothetical protein [Sphingobium sp. BS19]
MRIIGRTYPVKAQKRAAYLRGLVHAANNVIFGEGSATNFCRKLDQPCALEASKGKRSRATCEHAKTNVSACARSRPQIVVLICSDQMFDEAFDHLGRGVLFLRLASPQLPATKDLKAAIDDFEPIVEGVMAAVTQRVKSLYAPLAPDRNFQRVGGHAIAKAVQADPARFAEILSDYHVALYRSDFANPKKPGITGAYMLDADTGFQQDHFHKTVQTIGLESRKDGFHLLNAYHVYGVKSDPGFHFDVMNVNGRAIGHILQDVVSGKSSVRGDLHLNATPCDRLV